MSESLKGYENAKKQYQVCDQLSNNASIHCAALIITEKPKLSKNGSLIPIGPTHELRNGTLTFVKTGAKVYGITCWHVIEYFRKQIAASGDDYSYSMQTMVNGFYDVADRFIRPEPQYGDPKVDIAIRELKSEFVSAIGKMPIDLDQASNMPIQIEFGLAVGYPESIKYSKYEEGNTGYRISMPQVEILAEINNLPNRRFTLFSELPNTPEHSEYSGMSGGPIFWSREDFYGIYGVIYEGGLGSEGTTDNSTVYVYGELATPEIIRDWISQV